MRTSQPWLWAALCLGIAHVLAPAVTAAAGGARLPEFVVPDGLGTNIHFRGAPARDLDMLRAGGFRFIRMDFAWDSVEREKGVYRFGPYDELTDALRERGIRILYILDYSNGLYETDRSVRTAEGRRAFARFAETAARRYRGRGILWELWNEPNHTNFWRPMPSVEDYMALAREALPAVRRADPDAVIVAPATSGIPLEFIGGCFERGLLDLVDAVTVHPYRQKPPETVADDILALRALIARHKPDRPDVPVISGEWGYSAAWRDYDEARQGLYLPRQFLTNMRLGIPVSIWYDWHDDGRDPKEAEHNFGTVTWDYKPKPAYVAMKSLVEALRGMRFVKRLASGAADHLLLFADDERSARGEPRTIAAWTTGEAHDAELFPGRTVRLTGEVRYVPVPAGAESVVAEGSWTVQARSAGIRAGSVGGVGAHGRAPLRPEFTVRVRNGLSRKARVRLAAEASAGLEGSFAGFRGGEAAFALRPGQEREVRWRGTCLSRGPRASVTVTADVAGHVSRERTDLVVVNPVRLSFAPCRGGVMLLFDGPSGERIEGSVRVGYGDRSETFRICLGREAADTRGGGGATSPPSVRRASYSEGGVHGVTVACGSRPGGALRARVIEKGVVAADSGEVRLVPLEVSTRTARAYNDGDSKVPAEFELLDATYRDADAPMDKGLRFTYRYGKGWKFVRVAPAGDVAVEGKPKEIGVWVRGDSTGNAVRMRFRDANGRTFQPELGRLTSEGWRFLTARLDDPTVGHWGGTGDATRIAYPVRIDTFVLVDGTRKPVAGEAHFAGFCLVHRRR